MFDRKAVKKHVRSVKNYGQSRYAKKYNWETQCNDLVEMMLTLAHGEYSCSVGTNIKVRHRY